MTQSASQHIWNGIDLNELREVMDQPADEAVGTLYKSASMTELRNSLAEMAANDSVAPEDLPPEMQSFVNQELNSTFSDEDIKMFKKAHKAWREHGMNFCFILFFRSLPFTYMAEKPANVLRISKLLITQPERRILETAQFVFDVMDKNWWEADQRGILTAMKVRLLHAGIRHSILNDTENPWNNNWGKPISQEDLVATNQTFSLEIIKGMAHMGKSLPADEQEAWFHSWKRIGAIMGVEERLLCSTMDEAWELQEAVYDHLFHDEPHSGILLSEALVETMAKFLLSHRFVLHILRWMLQDENYPENFYSLLGPTYAEQYPILFEQPDDEEEHEDHQERLRADYHTHLKDFYHKHKERREAEGKRTVQLNWWQKILAFFGLYKAKKSGKFGKHFDLLHEILHEGDVMVEKLEDKAVMASMSALGGIIMTLLNGYFRQGKQAAFRIPEDLQEHWDLG